MGALARNKPIPATTNTTTIKIPRFKGHWVVPDKDKNLFIDTALAVQKNPEYGLYIFDDFKRVLSPIGRYVSAAEEAENLRIWNYNIPEFGITKTGNEIDYVIKEIE